MSLPFESESTFGKHGKYGVSQNEIIRQVSMRRIGSDHHLPRVRNQGHRANTFVGRLRHQADRFRDFLSTAICNCFDRIPSVFLVILAILVIIVVISSIPLAFYLSYSQPDAPAIDSKTIDNPAQDSTTIAVPESPTTASAETTVQPTVSEEPVLPISNRACLASSLMVDVQCADKLLPMKFACSGYYSECKGHCDKCDEELSFDCGNKVCISKKFVCDGRDDCGNLADESNCDCSGKQMCNAKTPSGLNKCFDEKQRCDGINDCPDGQDEKNCDACNNPQGFYCKSSKKCLVSIKRCNGIEDCDDGEDEMDCSCEDCQYSAPMYGCSSAKRCFRMDQVCQPTSQCPNATEEDELFCKSRTYNEQHSKSSSTIHF